MAIQLVQLPYKIEDVGQGKKKEEEEKEEGRRRNVGWIKVARSGNLRFLRGERKKMEKDISHRSHGTEEPATLVVAAVVFVVFVVASRERDRGRPCNLYRSRKAAVYKNSYEKRKKKKNDKFSMRGMRGTGPVHLTDAIIVASSHLVPRSQLSKRTAWNHCLDNSV